MSAVGVRTTPLFISAMNIILFLPNWLGDIVMATPTLRAIRRHFGPSARLVGLLRPYLKDMLSGTGWLDEQWYFDHRLKDRNLHSLAVTQRIRSEHFDLAVLFPNSFHTAIIARLGGVKRRVGYVRYGRGMLLTEKLYPQRKNGRIVPEPMVETYLRLARSIGCGEESPRLELTTTEADERSADDVFQRLGLRGDRPIAALNSSGAFGGSKLWPVEYFSRLARRIVDELDYDVLVCCGPKERDNARNMVRLAGGNA